LEAGTRDAARINERREGAWGICPHPAGFIARVGVGRDPAGGARAQSAFAIAEEARPRGSSVRPGAS